MLQSLNQSVCMRHQTLFRVLLNAMTHPGDIYRLKTADACDELDLIRGISQTLLDNEVTFALAGQAHPFFSAQDILKWTHSYNVSASEADFLIVTGPDGDTKISQLKRGTPERPDAGATAVFLLSRPIGICENRILLTIAGPGIAPPGRRQLPILAVSKEDIAAIQAANEEFPMGIDCFFIDPAGAVIGLPRSVTIRRVE
jgi:alpha-D-ribose 1-methylphosphonate 5-triphosphate synthase subunit PhnH